MKHLKRFAPCMAMAAAMALSLAACGGTPSGCGPAAGPKPASGDREDHRTVGTSNFTEVNILGEIYTELIEANTDYDGGDSASACPARPCASTPWSRASIDMFVEYTGTGAARTCWPSLWTPTTMPV